MKSPLPKEMRDFMTEHKDFSNGVLNPLTSLLTSAGQMSAPAL